MNMANLSNAQTTEALHRAAMASAAAKSAQQASRTPLGRRVILPAVAAVSIGAAVVMKGLSETMSAPRARADPRQNENQMLMDAYGSAESLEDLQKAMEHYQNK